MTYALVLVELASAVPFVWRLLRVAQREHYHPASIAVTLQRWIGVSTLDAALVGAALAGVVFAAVGDVPAFGLVGCAIVAIWPVGLPGFRGTPSLKWTSRVRRVAAIGVVLAAAVAVVAILVGAPAATAVAAVVVLLPLWFELALRIAVPIEHRLLDGFVRTASKTLSRVGPDVVAITGSYGKTSTKEHLRDLAGGAVNVVASPASFNNQAGLARTVNEFLQPGTQLLVTEMGTYGPGEIAEMCRWVKPRISAITAIGPVHLERMGTLDGILEAKSEILDGAEVAVLNIDDQRLAALADRTTGARVVRTSATSGNAADVSVATVAGEWRVTLPDAERTVPAVVGVHASNVAVALGCGVALGIDGERLIDGLGRLAPPAHRLEPMRSDAGVLVLDDTFNSNPAGARAALERLVSLGTGRRVVVTPGMVELGPVQAEENERFAAACSAAGVELVVVGRVNRRALLAGAGDGPSPITVARRAEAVAWVRSSLGEGDAVLYENDLPDHYP